MVVYVLVALQSCSCSLSLSFDFRPLAVKSGPACRKDENEDEHEHDWGSRRRTSTILVGEGTVEPVERETVSRAIGGARIYFFVSSYDRIFPVHFADPAP